MESFREAPSVLFLRLDDLPGRNAVHDELEVIRGELVGDLSVGADPGTDVDGGRADLDVVVLVVLGLGRVLALPPLVDLVEAGAHFDLEFAPDETLVLEAGRKSDRCSMLLNA